MTLVWADRFYGRSAEEGLPNRSRRSGDMTLSSAGELSPEEAAAEAAEVQRRDF